MSLLDVAAHAILALHIGGGTVGMLSGAAALLARKGGRLHGLAGTTFVISMAVMAGIGAGYPLAAIAAQMAPAVVQAPNAIAGIMALYLITTSWAAVRKRTIGVGALEIGGFVVALSVAAAGAAFIVMITGSPTGTIGSTPPQAFFVFLLVGSIAAASDLKVILAGGISGVPRVARHLWRMSVALTIATGSFFLGQEKVLPKFMQGSPWLFVPVFAPLMLMTFWLIRIRLKTWLAAGGLTARRATGRERGMATTQPA
jgi:hypothetical protein